MFVITECRERLARELLNAVHRDDTDKVKTLLESGANPNHSVEDAPPLHTACGNGNIEIVRALVTRGADVDKCDQQGWTPLHFACWWGHKTVVVYLIKEAGCKVGEL